MEKKIKYKPESGEINENYDFVYNFFMKLYFYLGIICYIPYFIILNILNNPLFLDSGNEILTYGLIIGTLFILFIMDIPLIGPKLIKGLGLVLFQGISRIFRPGF